MSKRKKKRKNKLILIILAIVIAVLAAVLGVYFYLVNNSVKKEIVIEAGSDIPAASEFKNIERIDIVNEDASLGKVDVSKVGDNKIAFKVLGMTKYANLKVVDTVAPEIVFKESPIVVLGVEPDMDSFVEKIEDETEVSWEFVEDYEFDSTGSYDVSVKAVDAGGNETVGNLTVKVVKDETAPVITGGHDITVGIGDSVSYKKGVEVTDDYDEKPVLEVDSSQVDLTKEGTYYFFYKAKDASGNATEQRFVIKVGTSAADLATEEEVYAKADEILAQILTPGMTQKQQAEAIFNYVYESIAYIEKCPKETLIKSAYKGLVEKRGDCSANQAAAHVLLTRAGIKNRDIEKIIIPKRSRHYWNLIDVGEGWYHFDTMKNQWNVPVFYWTDAQVKEFSDSHANFFDYDRTKYTGIQ